MDRKKREKMIEKYEKNLKDKIKKVKTKLDSLKNFMIVESYYDDVLDNPTAGGLSVFLGKTKISSDIMTKSIPDVQRVIKTCSLNSVDFYKTTRPILDDIAKEMEKLYKRYNKLVSGNKKMQTKRRLKIMKYFTKVYKNIIKEIFIDTLRSTYQKRRGDTKKTICGARCKDGHPCQRLFWEGWICWQHGGGRKD